MTDLLISWCVTSSILLAVFLLLRGTLFRRLSPRVRYALWAGGPQTLGQVLERLEGDTGWSRTTVHTYLTRMMGKGLVSADEHSPRRYSAAVTLEECAAQEERSLMDRAYGGSAGKLAAAFLRSASLTREERDELRRLLDEMEV